MYNLARVFRAYNLHSLCAVVTKFSIYDHQVNTRRHVVGQVMFGM